MYLNTVTSTENYILVTGDITESNKKKLSLIITCNNRLATVVEFLAKKSFLQIELNHFDQNINFSWYEEICNIDIDNNYE